MAKMVLVLPGPLPIAMALPWAEIDVEAMKGVFQK
jgi:hypothetical protein